MEGPRAGMKWRLCKHTLIKKADKSQYIALVTLSLTFTLTDILQKSQFMHKKKWGSEEKQHFLHNGQNSSLFVCFSFFKRTVLCLWICCKCLCNLGQQTAGNKLHGGKFD